MNDTTNSRFPDFEPEDVIATEEIEHPAATDYRSAARRMAVQILYEVDSADHPVGEVLASQLDYHQPSDSTRAYVTDLINGILAQYRKIDRIIRHFAPEFPLSQVALVDRNILRIAIYELGFDQRAPERVVIDEAVELAKLYGSEGTPRFVNGVLGAVVTDKAVMKNIIDTDAD
mgnify:CR=1 FL=1